MNLLIFWKNVKPFLFDKGTNIDKITLVDHDKVISDDKQLCKPFSHFFQEAVKTLGVSDSLNMSNYSHNDQVNNTIRKYENHPGVKKISETVTITSTFHFSGIDKGDEEKSIGNLNFKNIPTKCLK